MSTNFITVNWSAPKHIHAVSTMRQDGYSTGPYQGFNLGAHVQDDALLVDKNRQLLSQSLSLPESLCWLNQTHSTILLKIEQGTQSGIKADGSFTTLKNMPCVVMTADCLPVLVTDKQGRFVSAIHAGWRGLCDGIIEQSIDSICNELNIASTELLVWLGPCIGKTAFEVGEEVRAEFIAQDPNAINAFKVYQDRYLADLQQLARLRLAPLNIAEISASEHCTFSEPENFYSYRRDGKTGRMATLIWIA
jgi:YfiH family protein